MASETTKQRSALDLVSVRMYRRDRSRFKKQLLEGETYPEFFARI